MTREQIEAEIERLPMDEQVVISDRIRARAVPVDPDIEHAWAREAERRLDEMLSGKVKGIPAEEVLADMRRRSRERNRIPSSGEA